LCFTAPAARADDLLALATRLGLPLTPVGRVEAGQGVEVRDARGQPIALPQRGFDHFG
jgi:thiamine-monophosphate kinase